MIDYNGIKSMAKTIGRPVKDLLALSAANDPFYAGVGHRGEAAEWFAGMWRDYAGDNPHLRRIHYKLVSPPAGIKILLPSNREYQNTENDWTYLCMASLAARYLDLVPFDGLIDRRNDEPLIFASNLYADPNAERTASCAVIWDQVDVDIPDRPHLPSYSISGLDVSATVQDYIVEVWVEKSTQNDWLEPLCKRRGVNLVVGIGEQSEIRSRQLALRSSEYGAPVRILYLSDFDPGGRSMPKAVARKVEFTIAKFGLDVDLQLIPLALTPDQCREYSLPRTPIKDTERRKDKFEATFGIGATELDALEALYPGEMAKLVENEIDNFLDRDLRKRMLQLDYEQMIAAGKVEKAIVGKHDVAIQELTERFEEAVESLRQWEDEASELWSTISDELEEQCPDLSDVEIPRSEAPGETDRFVLFDSTRDYFTQMDAYNAWRDGAE
jgi:hypothetical protein